MDFSQFDLTDPFVRRALAETLAEDNGLDYQDEYIRKALNDEIAAAAAPKPIDGERNFLGDTVSRLARGGVQLADTAIHAVDTAVGGSETLQGWSDSLDKAKQNVGLLRPDKSEHEEGWLKRSYGQALESAPMSAVPWAGTMAGASMGAVAGPAGVVAGGLIGGMLAMGGLFGLGTYGQRKEEIERELTATRPDLTPDQISKMAHVNALHRSNAETWGETAGDLASWAILSKVPGGQAIFKGGKAILAELVKPNAFKAIALGVGKAMPFDVGSEVGTAIWQNEADKAIGVEQGTSTDAALAAIGPALFLSAGMGVAVGGYSANQRRVQYNALNSEDQETRAQAVDQVAWTLAEATDQQTAKKWRDMALGFVQNGQPIPLDMNLAELSANEPEVAAPEAQDQPAETILKAESVDEAIQEAEAEIAKPGWLAPTAPDLEESAWLQQGVAAKAYNQGRNELGATPVSRAGLLGQAMEPMQVAAPADPLTELLSTISAADQPTLLQMADGLPGLVEGSPELAPYQRQLSEAISERQRILWEESNVGRGTVSGDSGTPQGQPEQPAGIRDIEPIRGDSGRQGDGESGEGGSGVPTVAGISVAADTGKFAQEAASGDGQAFPPPPGNGFDQKGLTPGSPEYEAAYEQYAAGSREEEVARNKRARAAEDQASFDDRNKVKAEVVAWFDAASDGDTITTDMEGEEYRVKEYEVVRKGKRVKFKTLVLVGGRGGGRDRALITDQDGKRVVGPIENRFDEDGIPVAENGDSQSIATLGYMLRDGRAKSSRKAAPAEKLLEQVKATTPLPRNIGGTQAATVGADTGGFLNDQAIRKAGATSTATTAGDAQGFIADQGIRKAAGAVTAAPGTDTEGFVRDQQLRRDAMGRGPKPTRAADEPARAFLARKRAWEKGEAKPLAEEMFSAANKITGGGAANPFVLSKNGQVEVMSRAAKEIDPRLNTDERFHDALTSVGAVGRLPVRSANRKLARAFSSILSYRLDPESSRLEMAAALRGDEDEMARLVDKNALVRMRRNEDNSEDYELTSLGKKLLARFGEIGAVALAEKNISVSSRAENETQAEFPRTDETQAGAGGADIGPNTPDGYVTAKKQPGGKYKLFFTGTRNEVFSGELFDSAKQARDYFRVQREKLRQKQAHTTPKTTSTAHQPSVEGVTAPSPGEASNVAAEMKKLVASIKKSDAKLEKLHEGQLNRMKNGGQSRATSTTYAARAGNEAKHRDGEARVLANIARAELRAGRAVPQDVLDILGSKIEYNRSGDYEPIEGVTAPSPGEASPPPAAQPSASKATPEKPAGVATSGQRLPADYDPASDEERFYGSKVTIKEQRARNGKVFRKETTGRVDRVLKGSSGGNVFEVVPDGYEDAFRYDEGDIVIDELVDNKADKKDEVAPVKSVRPSPGQFVPASKEYNSTAQGQKDMSARGSRIAMLKGLNGAVGKVYTDGEIESAADENIDAIRDYLIERQRQEQTADAKPRKDAGMADVAETDFGNMESEQERKEREFNERIEAKRKEREEQESEEKRMGSRGKEMERHFNLRFDEDAGQTDKQMEAAIDAWIAGRGDAPSRIFGDSKGNPLTGKTILNGSPSKSFIARVKRMANEAKRPFAVVRRDDRNGVPVAGFIVELPTWYNERRTSGDPIILEQYFFDRATNTVLETVLPDEANRTGFVLPQDRAAQPAQAEADTYSSIERELQRSAHKGRKDGDIEAPLNWPGPDGSMEYYVSMTDAVAAARRFVAAGGRPVPFQIHNGIGVSLGDADTIIAALDSPAQPEAASGELGEEGGIVEHTTKRGKVLRGRIVTGISYRQAKEADPYTFKKDGGFFIREGAGEVKKDDAPAEVKETAPEKGEAQPKENLAIKRLRISAERLKAAGEAKLNQDRNANTARRARMANNAEADARADIRTAETLLNIVNAQEDGTAGALAGLTSKAQLETLQGILTQAKYAEERKKENGKQDHARPANKDDIKSAVYLYPHFYDYKDLDALIDLLGNKKGWRTKRNDLRRGGLVVNGKERIEMLREALKLAGDDYRFRTVGEHLKGYDRLQKAGITDDLALREALEKLVELSGKAPEKNRAQELERALVGQNTGIDFFPTPKAQAKFIVDRAGIEPGMRVLEPSAGTGNLAEEMRAQGGEVEVAEISPKHREVLEAKGFKIVEHDFMDMEEGGYDVIVMNPPFSNNMDIDHVRKAYELLKPGGRVVAIMGEGAFFRTGKKETEFREWLDEVGINEKLPEGFFTDKKELRTTGVNARVVEIGKPIGAETPVFDEKQEAVEAGQAAPADDAAVEPEAIPEQRLLDTGFLREFRDRWQYKLAGNNGWFTADRKEDAVERARKAYEKTPEPERLTAQERFDKSTAEQNADIERLYGEKSLPELRKEYARMEREIASLQKAGRREFDGNGGRRTGAAVSNEGARNIGEQKLKLGRYIEDREKAERESTPTRLHTVSGYPSDNATKKHMLEAIAEARKELPEPSPKGGFSNAERIDWPKPTTEKSHKIYRLAGNFKLVVDPTGYARLVEDMGSSGKDGSKIPDKVHGKPIGNLSEAKLWAEYYLLGKAEPSGPPHVFRGKNKEYEYTIPNSAYALDNFEKKVKGSSGVKFSERTGPTLESIKAKYAGRIDTIFVHERNDGDIHLASVIVGKGNRQQGIGSEFMADLVAYADANGKRIVLSPGQPDDRHGTTSRARLVRFYKRFGFIENKGRNKDYQISEGMYRVPAPKYSTALPPSARADIPGELTQAFGKLRARVLMRKITVLESQEEIKALAAKLSPDGMYSEDGTIIQAFAHNGHVYMAADGVEKGHVVRTLKHEFAHIARLGLRGTKPWQALLRSVDERMDEDSATGKALREARKKVPADTDADLITEETLAYAVELSPEVGLVRRAIAMIKRFLVNMGVSPNIFTVEDWSALAAATLRGQARVAMGEGVRQSVREAMGMNKQARRDKAQADLVKSKKRKPAMGERIRFIRYGEIVSNSTNWTDNRPEAGMSVYSLAADGAAEQTVRSEFSDRGNAYVGTGTVVGYGSDGEPLVSDVAEVEKATAEDIDKSEFYGMGKAAWRKYLDDAESGNLFKPVDTESAAFLRWFGDSKVKDSDGRPLVVYHGTDAEFEAFDTSDKSLSQAAKNYFGENIGSFFSSKKGDAKGFGKVGAYYLTLRTPKRFKTQAEFREFMREHSGRTADIRDEEGFILEEGRFENNMRAAIEAEGYDGVIIENPQYSSKKGGPWFIAFNPTQIKSATENTGDFSPSDPRIRYSKRFEADEAEIVERVKPALRKNDLKWWERVFKTFDYLSRIDPAAKRIFQYGAEDRRENKVRLEDRILDNIAAPDGAYIDPQYSEKKEAGFVSFLTSLQKKDKATYTAANDYLLTVDRTGKAFSVKRQEGYAVKSPDGEVLATGLRTKEDGYAVIRDHHAANYGKDSAVLKKDYSNDKQSTWAVADPKGAILSKHNTEAEAVAARREAEAGKMRADGKDEKTIAAVMKFREMTDRAFDLMAGDLRRVIDEAERLGLDEPTMEVVDERKRYVILDARGNKVPESYYENRKDAELFAESISHKGRFQVKKQADNEILMPMTLSAAISQMGDLRGSYFPRQRQAGAVVLTATKDGSNIRKNFDLYMLGGERADIETGEVLTESKIKTFLRDRANRVTPLGLEMARLKADGYTVKVAPADRMPETVFEATQLFASINALIEDAAKGVKKDADPNLQRAYNELAKTLTMNIADTFKQRGYLSSRMKRTQDYWEGFETDMLKAGVQYAKGMAGGLAKREAAQKMTLALTGRETTFAEYQDQNPGAKWEDYQQFVRDNAIDPKKQPRLLEETKSWMQEMLRNDEQADRILGTIKGLAVLKFLGFRVSSAAVNLTNMVQAVPATIAAQTGTSISRALGQVGSSARAYKQYRTGKAEQADKEIFTEISERGWDNPQFNHEAAAVLRSKAGNWFAKFTDAAMWMFGQAEKVNRAVTIHAAYVQAKRMSPDLGHVGWMNKAKQISDDAHGVYGKETAPAWTRGAYNPLKLSYTFQRFMHNYFLNMGQMWERGKYKELTWMLISPALIAGPGATLLTPIAASMLGALGIGGDDPEEEFYAWAEQTFGEGSTGARAARHGFSGALGVNLKGSLEMGFAMPTTVAELFGAPGSLVTDAVDSVRAFSKGEVSKGFEKALPTGMGTMLKAGREQREGITTGGYSPVWYGEEPLKTTGGGSVARFFGFTPSVTSGVREKLWSEKRIEQKYAGERKRINDRIRRLVLQNNGRIPREDMDEIRGEVARYNERARGLAVPGVPLIKASTIRQAIRGAKRPPRKERLRTNPNI